MYPYKQQLSIMTPLECEMLLQYVFYIKDTLNKGSPGSRFFPNSWCIYGDPYVDGVLMSKCSIFSEAYGKELVPTYSFARLYNKGEELQRHLDRDECEVSATCTVGLSSGVNTPIYFEAKGQDNVDKHNIPIGDAVLYRGSEYYHWREPIEDDWQLQVFFHYIEKDGQYKEHIRDLRPVLGLSTTRYSRNTKTSLRNLADT